MLINVLYIFSRFLTPIGEKLRRVDQFSLENSNALFLLIFFFCKKNNYPIGRVNTNKANT